MVELNNSQTPIPGNRVKNQNSARLPIGQASRRVDRYFSLKMANVKIQVESESDLTVFTVVGELTASDARDIIQKFYEGRVTLNVLLDLSQGDVSKISADDVHSIAHTPRKYAEMRKGGKSAIIAPTDIAFGLTRMYEFMTDIQNYPFKTQAFRTTQEAYRWLLEEDSP